MDPIEFQEDMEINDSEILGHEFHDVSKNAYRNIMFPEMNDEVAMDYVQDLT